MADLGRAALVVSLGLTLYAFIGGTIGALQKRQRLSDSARNALVAAFGSTVVAAAVLAIALVHHDFSFVYVYSHTSKGLSTIYALSAFWGGQEGSLLLWLLVLSGYGALAAVLNRRLLRLDLVRDRNMLAAILLGTLIFLIFYFSQPVLLIMATTYALSGVVIRIAGIVRRFRPGRRAQPEHQIG